MENIPFLRASIVPVNEYLDELERIDISHIYTNYGPMNQRFEETVMSEFFQNRGAVTTVANATLGLMAAIQLKKRKKENMLLCLVLHSLLLRWQLFGVAWSLILLIFH